MIDSECTTTFDPIRPNDSTRLGDDRLLDVEDVAEITGLCTTTAAKVIRESGRGITIHRRRYILASSLLEYLHGLEEANGDGR